MALNIKDVPNLPISEVPSSDEGMARWIFGRQTELEKKYFGIEKRTSFLVDLDSREGQTHIKDILWRITEEVGECLEVGTRLRVDENHIKEELADGLHFVTSLFVVTGSQREFVDTWSRHSYVHKPLNTLISEFIMRIGTLGNVLKMKPWKQTDVATDQMEFHRKAKLMLWVYLDICYCLGNFPNLHGLFDYYYRKSEVNLFRIRSNY